MHHSFCFVFLHVGMGCSNIFIAWVKNHLFISLISPFQGCPAGATNAEGKAPKKIADENGFKAVSKEIKKAVSQQQKVESGSKPKNFSELWAVRVREKKKKECTLVTQSLFISMCTCILRWNVIMHTINWYLCFYIAFQSPMTRLCLCVFSCTIGCTSSKVGPSICFTSLMSTTTALSLTRNLRKEWRNSVSKANKSLSCKETEENENHMRSVDSIKFGKTSGLALQHFCWSIPLVSMISPLSLSLSLSLSLCVSVRVKTQWWEHRWAAQAAGQGQNRNHWLQWVFCHDQVCQQGKIFRCA